MRTKDIVPGQVYVTTGNGRYEVRLVVPLSTDTYCRSGRPATIRPAPGERHSTGRGYLAPDYGLLVLAARFRAGTWERERLLQAASTVTAQDAVDGRAAPEGYKYAVLPARAVDGTFDEWTVARQAREKREAAEREQRAADQRRMDEMRTEVRQLVDALGLGAPWGVTDHAVRVELSLPMAIAILRRLAAAEGRATDETLAAPDEPPG